MAKYAKPFLFTVVGIIFAATLLAAPCMKKGYSKYESNYGGPGYYTKVPAEFWSEPIWRADHLSVSLLVIEWLLLAVFLFVGLWLIDSGVLDRLWLRIKTKMKE